jgi:hypothetical protein
MKSIMFGRQLFRFRALHVAATAMERGSAGDEVVMPGKGFSGWATILSPDALTQEAMDTPTQGQTTEIVDPTRVQVQVVTTSNCLSVVEFRVRLDMVETWFGHDLRAVFDREQLRAWLAVPAGRLVNGDVVFNADPRSRGERIAIGLTEVLAWTLSPKELHQLRELV